MPQRKEALLDLLIIHVNQIVRQESGQFWERRELEYLRRMILVLELNWPMTITSNGMVGPLYGVFEYNHVWEDGDERYTVENVPLYDSAEDEPFPKPASTTLPIKNEPLENHSALVEVNVESDIKLERDSTGKSVVTVNNIKEGQFSLAESTPVFSPTNAMISRIRSNSACRNYIIGPNPSSKKRPQPTVNQRAKTSSKKYACSKPVAELFPSKKAQEEIRRFEELKTKATSELTSLYDEIRPAIEEHERDSQDSVSTSVAEKWIQATCSKWKAEFDFHFSIIKNVMCPQNAAEDECKPSADANEIKYLTN